MREHRLSLATEMRARGMRARTAAKLVRAGESTLRRWRARARRGEPLARDVMRRARASLCIGVVMAVIARVRETNGAIGADALRHAVPGVSRREAASIKRDVETERERARVARAEPTVIVQPGVVRGFDGVHFVTHDGVRWLLVSLDASVPYRTSAPLVEHYDGDAVHDALERDWDEHGEPLVVRMDRASSHRVPKVRELCRRRGVLVLHGPPRRPQYYGQLERQNRPLREVIGATEHRAPADITAQMPDVLRVLNTRWPQRSLGWRTPGELWTSRVEVREDRKKLHAEVQQRVARIATRIGDDVDRAQRIAIESALYERGFLKLTTGAALNGIPC